VSERSRVRASARAVAGDGELDDVSIDAGRLDDLAERLAGSGLALPDWQAPVLLEDGAYGPGTVLDFFLVGNTVNVVFDDLETGAAFATTYEGDKTIAY